MFLSNTNTPIALKKVKNVKHLLFLSVTINFFLQVT